MQMLSCVRQHADSDTAAFYRRRHELVVLRKPQRTRRFTRGIFIASNQKSHKDTRRPSRIPRSRV